MAKIVLCGYGHDGRGLGSTVDGYAYIVNDNVNKGDVIQVVATNWKSGKKFGTTAQTLETHKENSVAGAVLKTTAESDAKSAELNRAIEQGREPNLEGTGLTRVYSGKELGVKGFRGSEDYQKQVRAQNVQTYLQNNPGSVATDNAYKAIDKYGKDGKMKSFDEYSKPFNGGNK